MSAVMVLKNSAPPLCMLGLLLPPCSNSLWQPLDQWSEWADFYGKKPKVRSLFFFFFTQIDRWVSNINKGGSNGIVHKRWGAWKYFPSLGGTCNQRDKQGYVVLFKSLLKQFSRYNLPQANRKFYSKYRYPALLNFDLHFLNQFKAVIVVSPYEVTIIAILKSLKPPKILLSMTVSSIR